MNGTKKRLAIFISALLIIYIIYNICFFVIPFNKEISNASYWISYGATSFVFICCTISTILGINDRSLKSRIFGIPILFLNITTIFVQIIFDLIVMIIGNFILFQSWITIVFETLLIGLFFLSLIAEKTYKDKIITIDKKDNKELFIRKLRIELELMRNSINDDSLLKAFDKLYEEVKYTDPVSKQEVYEVEEEISNAVSRIKKNIDEGNFVKAKKAINATLILVRERKSILSSI